MKITRKLISECFEYDESSSSGLKWKIDNKSKKVKGKDVGWHARIMVNGKRIHIGHFKCELEAAKAYDNLAFEHFGEYARLNIDKAK